MSETGKYSYITYKTNSSVINTYVRLEDCCLGKNGPESIAMDYPKDPFSTLYVLGASLICRFYSHFPHGLILMLSTFIDEGNKAQQAYMGRRKWQPTPVFLPREPCGQRSLVGCCP